MKYLIIGLGNPGEKYRNTYHNIGFKILDNYAAHHGVKIKKSKARAKIAEFNFDGNKVVLAKPQTYMNLSGESVAELLNKFKIESNNILVIYDDIDLQAVKLRYRISGSPGTHNGMKSIVKNLKTKDFPRLRVGIKFAEIKGSIDKYVLGNISKDFEKTLLEKSDVINEFIDDFIKDRKTENESL